MLETLLLAAPATVPDHKPVVTVNRWHDSGHKVWRGVPRWIRNLGWCIAKHESFHSGHYRARNPQSTASGRYQMLRAMWQGNAKWFISIRKYPNASDAPRYAQDMAFINSMRHEGVLAWKGTGCGYGT